MPSALPNKNAIDTYKETLAEITRGLLDGESVEIHIEAGGVGTL